MNGARPPAPGTAGIEPTPVMVGGPTPGLIGNPGPSPVRLPNPTALTVGRPVRIYIRRPDIVVAGHIGPVSIAVEIVRTRVIAVGITPALCLLDNPISILIPAVPIIVSWGSRHMVLGFICTLNGDEVVLFCARAALRRRNFGCTLADDDLCLGI